MAVHLDSLRGGIYQKKGRARMGYPRGRLSTREEYRDDLRTPVRESPGEGILRGCHIPCESFCENGYNMTVLPMMTRGSFGESS